MSASDLRWLSQEYTLRELLEDYEDALPQIAVVRGGYCGINNQHSFSSGERFLIHGIQTQQRIVARDAVGRQYSIPPNIANKLKITKRGKAFNKPIKSITTKWKSSKDAGVYKIHFTNDVPVSYCYDADVSKIVEFNELDLVDHYEEKYLVSSCITGNDTLHSNLVAIPVYVDIRLSLGEDKKVLQHFVYRAGYVELSQCKLNTEIIILPRILDTTVEDIYMYVVPQSTLSSCDAQHIYEPVASPRKSPVTLPVTSQWTSTTPSQDPKFDTVSRRSRGALPALPTEQSILKPRNLVKPRIPKKPDYTDRDQFYDIIPEPVPVPVPRIQPKGQHIQRLQSFPLDRSNLTVTEVSAALSALNLEKYIPQFQEHAIDGSLLNNLNAQMLEEEFHFKSFEAMKLVRFANGWTPKQEI